MPPWRRTRGMIMSSETAAAAVNQGLWSRVVVLLWLLWAGWALGADDGFGALSDGELARVVKTLKQVLARAEEIQSAREDAR